MPKLSRHAGLIRSHRLAVTICLLGVAGTGCTQEDPAVPSLAIVGVAVVDVGNGVVIPNQIVLVAATRITNVGGRDSISIPQLPC